MKGREKIAPCVIDRRQLSQIDFDCLAWSQGSAPGLLCFSDPRALELPREFEPAYRAIFVNRDAQHIVANVYGTESAKTTDLLNARKVRDWPEGKNGVCQEFAGSAPENGQMPGSGCSHIFCVNPSDAPINLMGRYSRMPTPNDSQSATRIESLASRYEGSPELRN